MMSRLCTSTRAAKRKVILRDTWCGRPPQPIVLETTPRGRRKIVTKANSKPAVYPREALPASCLAASSTLDYPPVSQIPLWERYPSVFRPRPLLVPAPRHSTVTGASIERRPPAPSSSCNTISPPSRFLYYATSPLDDMGIKLMDPVLGDHALPGRLYIFRRESSPGLVKIGYTRRPLEKRLAAWAKKCGYTPTLVHATDVVKCAGRAE